MKKNTITALLLCFSFICTFAQHHNSERAYLGVYANPVSKKKSEKLNFEVPNGNYITKVINNTAAAKNGLQPFDYIYQIGENQFKSHQSIRSALRDYQPGEEAMVYFIRNGKEESRMIKFGSKDDGEEVHRSKAEDPFLGVSQNHSDVPEEVVGVPVSIVSNSTAKKMGMEDDDIILEINDFPIYDWHDLGAAIDMMEVGDEMKVKFMRRNMMTTTYAPIQSLAATRNHGNEDEETNETSEPQEKTIATVENDMDDMVIEMDNMPEEKAEEMKNDLGIDMPVVQNLQIEQLNIFPNPSEGVFNLKFNLPNQGATAIRIFNGSGKMIYSNDLGNFQGEFNERLDLSSNPAGTYYLMVQQGELSVSKQVVIVRA